MYKHILENAHDISWMALLPLVIFFVVFSSALIMAMVRNTKDMDRLAKLPLEESLDEHTENGIST